MRTADFDYALPPELIAQHPAPKRDESRLLVLHRNGNRLEHRRFPDLLEFLRAGDVLVLNNSRVIPARLRGVNARTGGKFEILLLEEKATNDWWVMLRPGKSAHVGTQIVFHGNRQIARIRATIVAVNDEGLRRLQFSGTPDINHELDRLGEVPLPPYITRANPDEMGEDKERYQTIYAQIDGSAAAPTAGLHFTGKLLDEIRARGVTICFVTLHIGPGTFAPLRAAEVERHTMEAEWFTIPPATQAAIEHARRVGGRIVAVGTSSTRALESWAITGEAEGFTGLFIHPGFRFKLTDAMLTNFHMPRSTVLAMVMAFAGRELTLAAYRDAIRHRYRFLSYGDAMLIL